MADLIEDPKKKKASFGDAAAAATDPGVTQLSVGKPGDFPVNPDGTPMQKMAAGALPPGFGALSPAPSAADAAMNAHMGALKSANDQAAARLARPLAQTNTAQATAEYEALQKTANDLRPSYFSQQTPSSAAMLAQAETAANNALRSVYTQQGQPAQAVAAPNTAPASSIPGLGDATMPGADMGRFAAPVAQQIAASDAALPPAAGKDVGFGVRRIDAPGKSPLFTNVASAADNAALQGRGSISAQNMGAAQGLSDTFAAESRAAAQKAQYDQEVATAQAINARPIQANTGGFGLLSKEYQDRRNASFAPPSLSDARSKDAAILAQNAAIDTQNTHGVDNAARSADLAAREKNVKDIALMRNQEETTRLAQQGQQFGASHELAKQRLALDSKTQGAQAAQYGAEARLKGVQANAAEQLAALQNRYMTAKPEEQAAIAKQIQAISGKSDRAQMHVVNQPDTMTPDGMTRLGGGQRLVVQGADGSFHEVPVGGGQAAGISADARAIAIRDNKSMSVDEKRKQLQALGYK